MEVALAELGKKYGKRWVFQDLNQHIEKGDSWAICGANGSGKSTLLKIIGNYHTATRGKVIYSSGGKTIPQSEATLKMSYTGPDQNLIEELTLEEQIHFHFQFKRPLLSTEELIQESGLKGSEATFIHDFSSGMKQRLKLALALYSEADLLLLDEPTAFMDQSGIDWYRRELLNKKDKITIIIASNQSYEYDFTQKIIQL